MALISIANAKISWVRSATSKATVTGTVAQLIDGIKSGRWSAKVRHVRKLVEYEAPKASVQAAKAELPAVLFSGVFTVAKQSGFSGKHTGIICADFDMDDPEDVLDACGSLPWVAGWFRSPSGHGMKVLCVTAAQSAEDHLPAWHTVAAAFAALGLTVDRQCKDYSRLCYVSEDPLAHLREALPLPIDASAPRAPELKDLGNLAAIGSAEDAALEALAAHGPAIEGRAGDLHTFRACAMGHEYGVELQRWCQHLDAWNQGCQPPWNQRELHAKAASAYRNHKSPFGYLSLFQGVI